METGKFRVHRLLLYFVLVSLFLFVSGHTGQYLIHTHGVSRETGVLLQGVIFTSLTLIVLYILKRKYPDIFAFIGLKRAKSRSKLIVGIALPFILLCAGILTAYLFGGIENVRLNLTPTVIIAIFINTITALTYEAFPEEVFLRGLIFAELRKKFSFVISLVLQLFFFLCVPMAVMGLASIFFGEPFTLTLDYVVLLFTFGIALQLYKQYTGTLWMSILFHVIYLEVVRFISQSGVYDSDAALLEFDESFGGFMTLYLSFLFIVILSVVVLTVLLVYEKRKSK